jgi:DinB superfamily
MADDEQDAAACAADIEAARDRLIAFAIGCSEQEWRAAPLDGDPRPVGVVVDHVADSYEYLAGWIRQLVAGQSVEVTGEIVDDLNADHAAAAMTVSQADAAEHLRRSGAAISALVAGLSADDLAAGDGRVRRLAQIAIRHADNHRTDIETALAAQGLRQTADPAGTL